VYFAKEILATKGESFEGKPVAVSGFGNVAWGAGSKINELGGKGVTRSGPDGYVHDPECISGEKINYMLELMASNEDVIKPFSYDFNSAKFVPGKHPWEVECDIAMPCATENELNEEDAKTLIKNGCICICEGANMPCTPAAIEAFQENKVLCAPGKAANGGGVATSGLELSQNSMKLNWQRNEVDRRLHEIMENSHVACVEHGTEDDGYVNYVKGANIAGFIKVADAMLAYGVV